MLQIRNRSKYGLGTQDDGGYLKIISEIYLLTLFDFSFSSHTFGVSNPARIRKKGLQNCLEKFDHGLNIFQRSELESNIQNL